MADCVIAIDYDKCTGCRIGEMACSVRNSGGVNPVHVHTRSDPAGGPATWAEFLGGMQTDLKGMPVEREPGILDPVRGDRLGVGYSSLIYAYDLSSGSPQPGIEVVPIGFDGDEAISPEEGLAAREQAINTVSFGASPPPLSGELNLVTSGQPSGLARGLPPLDAQGRSGICDPLHNEEGRTLNAAELPRPDLETVTSPRVITYTDRHNSIDAGLVTPFDIEIYRADPVRR